MILDKTLWLRWLACVLCWSFEFIDRLDVNYNAHIRHFVQDCWKYMIADGRCSRCKPVATLEGWKFCHATPFGMFRKSPKNGRPWILHFWPRSRSESINHLIYLTVVMSVQNWIATLLLLFPITPSCVIGHIFCAHFFLIDSVCAYSMMYRWWRLNHAWEQRSNKARLCAEIFETAYCH